MSDKTPATDSDEVTPSASGQHREVQETSRSRSRWTAAFEDGWALEWLSLFSGCAIFLALCVVLKHYDGQAVPNFGNSINGAVTLNTIVAILAASVQAFLLYPVAECLSQLKWRWLLNTDRSLDDVCTFDKASRGPIGSLNMLWTIKWAKLGTLGAILIISAITVQPFFQQLIAVVSRTVPVDGAEAVAASPVVRTWNDGYGQEFPVYIGGGTLDTWGGIPSGFSGAIQAGLFSQNQTIVALSPTCSTGNCTFASYKSLAICASFANITSSLNQTVIPVAGGLNNQNTTLFRYQLTPKYYLDAGTLLAGYNESTTGTRLNVFAINNEESLAFRGINRTLINVLTIFSPNAKDAYASEFMLRWCVQEYNTTVVAGRASTAVTASSTTEAKDDAETFYLTSDGQGGAPETYPVAYSANGLIRSHLRTLFNGSITYSDVDLYATSLSMQPIYQSLRTLSGTSMNATIANMATSMTNYVRSNSAAVAQDGKSVFAQGVALKDVTTIVIRWQWITGPALFAGLAVVFVVSVILSSRTSELRYAWKSSPSAMMHAMDPHLRKNLNPLANPSELRHFDQKSRVRLIQDSGGGSWKVVAGSTMSI